MRVHFEELARYASEVTMVDGCFDPLHHGHLAYFREAARLGRPVLCNIASDDYLATKHPPLLKQEERAELIEALEPIDIVHTSNTGTVEVLKALRPKVYVKGKDWQGRLPEDQVELCGELGIEIVYTDTVLSSSSAMISSRLAPEISEQVSAYEAFLSTQSSESSERYDEAYFTDDWRENANNYSLEARRSIEGRNPELIREVFGGGRVLDMGCGPGALMSLLEEQGVQSDGVDFSQSAREIAPASVRERIHIGSITDIALPDRSYDLVICREVLEHMTVLDVQKAVQNMCRISDRFIYVTTRFHPGPNTLFDVTTEFDVDPTHITLMNMDMLRLMFVLQGCRRRSDLEHRMDWLNKGRVLVYEKI